jgi:hypothetical protein
MFRPWLNCGRSLILGAVGLSLAGCSVGAVGIAPPTAHGNPSWMRLRSGSGGSDLTYVGQFWDSINAYETNNRRDDAPICSIPASGEYPEGLATDSSGTLYVAGNYGKSLGVATFAPRCGAEGKTFDENYGEPADPAVDGTRLYLSISADVALPGSVVVYDLSGGQQPTGRLTDPAAGTGFGVAVDSHHNLFWSNTGEYSGTGQIIEFRKGRMPGTVLRATLTPHFPGGVLVDRSDNLLFIDQSASAIYAYAPPYKAPPFTSIALKSPAVYCAFGIGQTKIYCLDYANGSVDAYSYPKGTYLYSYTNGIEYGNEPIGIAVGTGERR